MVSISGKKRGFLLPIFVSKPAQWLTQSFTHLVIAVTLFVITPICVQIQALKYYVKLYPLFKRGLLLQLALVFILKSSAFCNTALCASLTKLHSRNYVLRLEIQL
jgi:hypothetical protein